MELTQVCAFTSYPNTAESDKMSVVLHTVEAHLFGRRVYMQLMATAPDDAIRIAKTKPLGYWRDDK